MYFCQLRRGGMVVFTAVLTNMLLSLFLHKEIGMFGWSMRGAFVCGVLGDVLWGGWEELKR